VIQLASKGTETGGKVNSPPAAALASWLGGGPPVDERQHLLARALAGEPDALHQVLAWPDVAEFAAAHRLAPALALASRRAGLRSYPATLDRELYWATGRNLLVNQELRKAGQAFGDAGVPWVLIKGVDLASRVYAHPWERVFTDVDILVQGADLGRALTCLKGLGWLEEGGQPFDAEALLGGERYVVTAGRGSGLVVELHYRLWGWMPAAMGDTLVAESEPHPSWGATARRPALAWAFLLAAVHAWQPVRPRPMAGWRDLERLAASAGTRFAAEAVHLAQRWAVQLPVALSAWQTARLWGDSTCGEVARRLLACLRAPERLAASHFARRGEDATPLGLLVLARLLACRPSRLGWRSVGQVLWPAEETVHQLATPGGTASARLTAIWRSLRRAVRQ
jgi:hypothetical protein